MRFLALALGALMLTACVTMHDPREMRARQALSDHWHCKDYGFGFEQGTEDTVLTLWGLTTAKVQPVGLSPPSDSQETVAVRAQRLCDGGCRAS
jgi:hypothetical protein